MYDRQISQFHNPHFDPFVDEAHAFATRKLGLEVSRKDQAAIVDERNHDYVRRRLGTNAAGGFNPATGDIVVFAEGDAAHPAGADVRARSQIVHEFTHSGTVNLNYHVFWNEALAGMGEAKYLQWLEQQARWKPAVDHLLERAGVRVWVPGQYRYYEPAPGSRRPANTSNGLIAVRAMGLGMYKSGIKVADVMSVSSPGGDEQFAIMRSAMNSIQPGLAREVERFPSTTDGIIQVSAVVEEAAARHGIA